MQRIPSRNSENLYKTDMTAEDWKQDQDSNWACGVSLSTQGAETSQHNRILVGLSSTGVLTEIQRHSNNSECVPQLVKSRFLECWLRTGADEKDP